MSDQGRDETIEGAVEAAKRFGTPVTYFDFDDLVEGYRSFVAEWEGRFPNFDLAYSYKTNPLTSVVQLLNSEGVRAEVVSGMEFDWAVSDGFDPDKIIFNGPVKRDAELTQALSHDAVINVDSVREFERLRRLATPESPARVGIRVRCESGEGSWSRFGLPPEEAERVLATAAGDDRLKPMAVHQHIGSNIADPQRFESAIRNLVPVVETLFSYTDPTDCIVDVGGGFPVECTRPVDAEEWDPPGIQAFATAVYRGLDEIGSSGATIVIEPGRALVEPHGYLICEVIDRYTIDGRESLVIDGGANTVPSIYVYERPVSFAGHDSASGTTDYDIYGPLCLQSDQLGSGVTGPDTIQPGDYVVLSGVGGYDVPGAYSWIRPRPAIVAEWEGQTKMVRNAETPTSVRQQDVQGAFEW